MKKYLFLFVAALSLLTSCEFLEVAPEGPEINDKDKQAAYQNETSRQMILGGIYSYLYKDDMWGGVLSIRMEAGTDISVSRSESPNRIENNSHTVTTLNNTWAQLYGAINAANEFIFYTKKYYDPENFENKLSKQYKATVQEVAEARYLRAYLYFTLVRMFGDVPMRTLPTSDMYHTDIKVTPAIEIYEFIVDELTELAEVMLEANDPIVTYGHVGRSAAQITLADVYLNLAGKNMKGHLSEAKTHTDWTEDKMYVEAEKWANMVVESPVHALTTPYQQVFMEAIQYTPNLKEQIWQLQTRYQRAENGYVTDSRLGKYNGMGKNGQLDPTEHQADAWIYQAGRFRELYEEISEEDGNRLIWHSEKTNDFDEQVGKDERAAWNATLYENGEKSKFQHPVYHLVIADRNNNTTKEAWDCNHFKYYPGKWRSIFAPTKIESASKSWGGSRLSMYRISEAYLLRAEALNAMGRGDEAVDMVNAVRDRAHATLADKTVYNTPEKIFNLIVNERARELCFEGKRRFDLMRWGNYEEKMLALKEIYDNAENESWVDKKTGCFDMVVREPQKLYIFPIPEAELSRNGLIEQNEVWK